VPMEKGCGCISTSPRIPLNLLLANNEEVVTPGARCKLWAYSRTDARTLHCRPEAPRTARRVAPPLNNFGE
jgi:hypothetical protein